MNINTCWICSSQAPRTEHGWQVVSAATDKELHQFTTCGSACREMAATLLDGMLRLRRWQTGDWKFSA